MGQAMTALTIIGIALAGNLLSGVVGFIIGCIAGKRIIGPKPTGEVYSPKHPEDVPF